jgi:hypothetical protein
VLHVHEIRAAQKRGGKSITIPTIPSVSLACYSSSRSSQRQINSIHTTVLPHMKRQVTSYPTSRIQEKHTVSKSRKLKTGPKHLFGVSRGGGPAFARSIQPAKALFVLDRRANRGRCSRLTCREDFRGRGGLVVDGLGFIVDCHCRLFGLGSAA